MINKIRPYELLNDYLLRLGNPTGDGGYSVPNHAMRNTDILYSYGVGDNTSFEEDYILRTGKTSHGYDHTIDFKRNITNYTFHKEGLSGNKTDNTNNFLYHLKENGDEGKNVLLKIDVEGAEYEWIYNTDITEVSKSVTVLVIEFHNASCNIAGSLDRLFDKYRVVHWHSNNFGGIVNNFPEVPEITFLHKDIEIGDFTTKNYPIIGLDVPNNGQREVFHHKYI